MADDSPPRSALRWQADFCRKSDAPILARVCDALAECLDDTSATGRRVLGWPGDPIVDGLPLRAAAPFHALVRSGRGGALDAVYRGEVREAAAIAAALRAAIRAHDAAIAAWLDGPPQTNEPARSGVLMAGLLALAARFAPLTRFELLEIGSSAGLNLMIDRYSFDLGGVRAGPADAPLHIAPDWRGPPPPAAEVRIESVRGVDVAPLDLADAATAERLMAYIWIDQADRLERTARAIRLARAAPPRLEQGDAADWIEARLAEPQADGVVRVLMHSIVWQYLPPATQARIEAAMAAAGANARADRPLGWVAYEGERGLAQHGLTVRSWPGDGRAMRLASAHPHGAWIAWSAPVEELSARPAPRP